MVPTAPAPPPLSRAGRRAGGLVSRFGLPAGVAGVIIGLWYLVSELALNQYQRFMLPPPHRVLEVGFFTWSNFTALMSALRLDGGGHVHRPGDLDRARRRRRAR